MNERTFKPWREWLFPEACELLIGWTLQDMLNWQSRRKGMRLMVISHRNPEERIVEPEDRKHLEFALLIISGLHLGTKDAPISLFSDYSQSNLEEENRLAYTWNPDVSVQRFLDKVRRKPPFGVVHALRREVLIGN